MNWIAINLTKEVKSLKCCKRKYLTLYRNCDTYVIVSSPLKLGGVLTFEIWKKRGVMKKLLRNRGLVKRGGFQIISSVFLKESMFSLLLEYFFLSGKYSHLLWSIDLFFHVVYFLLENDILWNFFSSYS